MSAREAIVGLFHAEEKSNLAMLSIAKRNWIASSKNIHRASQSIDPVRVFH
jgi:hypothetical protein